MTKDDSARAMLDEQPRTDAPIDDPTCTICHPSPAVPAPSHLVTIDGDMIREVSRVQHDKTLQMVRDVVDRLATTKKGGRNDWQDIDRTAKEFRRDLLDQLLILREQS